MENKVFNWQDKELAFQFTPIFDRFNFFQPVTFTTFATDSEGNEFMLEWESISGIKTEELNDNEPNMNDFNWDQPTRVELYKESGGRRASQKGV